MSQCLNCGYSTAQKLLGTKQNNLEYKKMTDDYTEEFQNEKKFDPN